MSEDIRISEFNELQFKMIRVHKLQDQINELWNCPLMMNFNFGSYNYESIFSNLQSLYAEVYAKCTPDEIKEYNGLEEEIEKLIEDEPPFEFGNHPTSKKASLNKDNWKEINKKLSDLRKLIKRLLDNHGYSPDKDDGMSGL